MKFLLKLVFGIVALVVLIVALAFGCVFMLEKVVPGMAAERLKAMSGYRLEVGGVDLSIVGGSADVKNIILRNPEGWPEEDFLTINRATFDVDPMSLLGSDQKVIDELIMDLGPVCIVTDKDKNVNAQTLLEKLRSKTGEEDEGETTSTDKDEPKAESKPLNILIRHLVIRMDSIRVADYSGPTPKIREQALKINIDMHDVTDVKQIVAQVIAQGGAQILMMLSNVQLKLGDDGSDDDASNINSVVDPLKKSVEGIFKSLKDLKKEH